MSIEYEMLLNFKLLVVGCHLTIILTTIHSFVLLTANVEDLKRIAQKFVSDSLADKISRFILEASNDNVSKDNESYDKVRTLANKRDDKKEKSNQDDKRVINQNNDRSNTIKSDSKIKNSFKKDKSNDQAKTFKKTEKKEKRKTENKMRNEESSLEYFRGSDNHLGEINSNLIIDFQKIIDSDESKVKISRKEFSKLKSAENQSVEYDLASDVEKDNLTADGNSITKKADSEETSSEDISYNNKLENKSDEAVTGNNLKTPFTVNLTTAKERIEFDQYLNTNYPKAKIVATSGALALRKPSYKLEISDSDYD